MSSLASAGFTVFILVLFLGIYLSLLGLPGTILIFLDILIYAAATGFVQVGWKLLLFLLIFAVIAEAIDVLLGMTRAYKPPVLRKTLWSTALGALAGALILTPFFWGPGSWMGFFTGGLGGFAIAELLRLSKMKGPSPASNATFMAMVGTKMLKGLLTVIMIFVSLSNIYS